MSNDLQISLQNEILLVEDRVFSELVLLVVYLEKIEDRGKRFVAQREVMNFLVNKHDQMKNYLEKVFDLLVSDATVVTLNYDDFV